MPEFLKRPEAKRAALIFVGAFVAVECIVLFYYSVFDHDRVVSELIISAAITMVAGIPAVVLLTYQSIRVALLNERLAFLSATDQMTGLLNRQTFLDRLALHLHAHGRTKPAGAFAYIDADRFKLLNDRFGHEFGDEVIVFVADRIRAVMRPGDLCARLGGEEFGVFLRDVGAEEGAALAERLRKEVELEGLAFNKPGSSISVSVGMAIHRPGLSAMELMREADRSLMLPSTAAATPWSSSYGTTAPREDTGNQVQQARLRRLSGSCPRRS